VSAASELLLALDTSASAGRAGLVIASGDRVEVAVLEGMPARTEDLAPATAALLASWGKSAADLTAVAAVVGPGSYTGLRSGLAFLRGLAFVEDFPAVGVGALELLAFRGSSPGEICVACVPGGQGRVVCARYRRDSEDVEELEAPVALAAGELRDWLASSPSSSPVVVMDVLREELAEAVCAVGLTLRFLASDSLGALASLAMSRLLRGLGTPVAQLLPVYVGASHAHPNRNRVAVRVAAE
jgi:tRNA threonylcarbamoyladenosine biosynthesis protein TsaB